jgi:hypothetical protein
MKKLIYLISTLVIASVIFSCTPKITRFIEIEEPDVIYEYGKGKFEVYPGDTLGILEPKTCRGGSGICYKVQDMETGEIGYVRKTRMEERHRIYEQK